MASREPVVIPVITGDPICDWYLFYWGGSEGYQLTCQQQLDLTKLHRTEPTFHAAVAIGMNPAEIILRLYEEREAARLSEIKRLQGLGAVYSTFPLTTGDNDEEQDQARRSGKPVRREASERYDPPQHGSNQYPNGSRAEEGQGEGSVDDGREA